MDPHETLVKNPYAHISIPRAHLRPELGQQRKAGPSSAESQPPWSLWRRPRDPRAPRGLPPSRAGQPVSSPVSPVAAGSARQDWPTPARRPPSAATTLPITAGAAPAAPAATAPASAAATAAAASSPSPAPTGPEARRCQPASAQAATARAWMVGTATVALSRALATPLPGQLQPTHREC